MVSTSASQAFVVTAVVSHLHGARPAEDFVKETNLEPGAPAEDVKVDGKGSKIGGPSGVAPAAPLRPTAACAPVGLGLSGTPLLSRGPGDLS